MAKTVAIGVDLGTRPLICTSACTSASPYTFGDECLQSVHSKQNYLPEPELRKVKIPKKKLKETTSVRAKTIRKAWWED